MPYIDDGGPVGNSSQPGLFSGPMSNMIQKTFPTRLVVALGSLLVVLVCLSFPAYGSEDDTLRVMRAARREAMLDLNRTSDKSDGPALFGLLVIPVDFTDARLPDSWDPNQLTNRLTAASGESLRQYFEVASVGRLDLRVTQAPVVHLPGTRRDYSDVGYNGFTRTRALASESLEEVRALGLEFRRLDMDGPDRIPGTSDDDGVIDGVLILHAGIGQENDPDDGLVQALQFFLEEPVSSQGIDAIFYAVASLQSGPGIWAHETAHLLGLEDRYDPGLKPSGGSEVLSLGGLGRFSLMASGAWGTGGGYGAALPDAYSCLQIGWYEEIDLSLNMGATDTLGAGVSSGQAGWLWTKGERRTEYFLLETRDPVAAFPFDADIPGGDLAIYHIDETLPEGQHQDDGDGTWHLRASLVEADDDFRLRRGEDPGRAEDLFPGPLGKDEFSPWSLPASDGYQNYSGIGLIDITPLTGGVEFKSAAWPAPALDFSVGFSGVSDVIMDLAVRSGGLPLGSLSCTASVVSSPSHGSFAEGLLSVSFDLVDDGDGTWLPVLPVPWYPSDDVASDANTSFHFDFQFDGGVDDGGRTWYWKDNGDVLDFSHSWHGLWRVRGYGSLDTYWWRWNSEPWLTADETPVLACTGFDFQDGSAWPEVHYQNSANTSLTSSSLGPEIRAVRLVHAMEVEYLTADVAMDGGAVVWVDPQDREIVVAPLEGWRGRIAEKSVNVLHGQEAMIEKDLELEDGIPLWRTDIIPVPSEGPGPWRLRLKFGSNSLWRYRGWFVASFDPVTDDPVSASFNGRWDESPQQGLSWSWPWGGPAEQRFLIQHRPHPDASWTDIADGMFSLAEGETRYHYPADLILTELEGSSRQRHDLRVVGFMAKGRVATRDIVVFPDGGDGQTVTLSAPWPNPAHRSVRFLAEIPPGATGNLGIFDLRGRKVYGRLVSTGSHLLEWDGSMTGGGKAASGTYVIRLEGSGPALMHKVVLLH